MPRPTMDQIRGIGDFQTNFRWNLVFSSFPNAVASPPTTDALNFRCLTSDIPKANIQMMDITIRGQKVKQNGIMEYAGTLALTFQETVDVTMRTFIKNWREAIWATNTGVSALKSDLQCTVNLYQLDNLDNQVWQYQLVGAILSDYDLGNLDGAGNDTQKPSITLSYDRFIDGAPGF
jgi:hypothetical protein